MGKRQIGEMEPFELVITLIIADLATIPMAEQTIPLWYGVIPLLVICVIHFVVSAISKKSATMRDIISGKPVVVIDDNGIDFEELKKLNISCEELMEALRNLDYFDMADINYAIIERNGKITVIPKASSMPVTREDKNIIVEESDLYFTVVENGTLIKKNFKEMGLQHDVVMPRILHNIKCSTKDILFLNLSDSGDVYVQKKGMPAQTIKITMDKSCFVKGTSKKRDGRATLRTAGLTELSNGKHIKGALK
jgi:uncharacterized membrane protein YcaP (DUF421 family)